MKQISYLDSVGVQQKAYVYSKAKQNDFTKSTFSFEALRASSLTPKLKGETKERRTTVIKQY